MTEKFINLSILIFLFMTVVPISCKQQKTEWQGTIEEVDGVTVVKNPKEPIYEGDVFILEEELSIGETDGQPEYMFSYIRSIAVDEEERIYVLDWKEALVKVFDLNGKYLKTIGKKGQGPGEFQSPLTLMITSQNELVVEDIARALSFFSLEGKFIRNLSTATIRALSFDIDSEGNMIANVIVREKENPRYELRKFDSELNFLYALGSSPLPSVNRSGFNPFIPTIRAAINQKDQIITGYPEKYEIKIFDKSGTFIRRIMKEYDPVEITEEEIKEATEGLPPDMKFSIPKYHNAYSWFITDDEGRIFVRTYERTADGKGYYCDVFDEEGKYIAKILLSFTPRIWKNNKIYTIEEDEEGYQYIKRYKATWKY
jgi:hypothetical protein